MILQTHESWELGGPFKSGFFAEGIKQYRMVKLVLSVPMLIVEVLFEGDADEEIDYWQRFLLTTLSDVQGLLATQPIQEFRLSLLLPRWASDDFEFTVSSVLEAYDARGPQGEPVYVYQLADGRRFVDSPTSCREEDLVNKRRVLSCQKPRAPVGGP